MPAVITDGCTGCGACIDACPEETIEMKGDVAVVCADDCTSCGLCVDECPEEVIEMQ